MQVEQSFQVQFPRALVWRSFHDTAGIVACLPGASLTAPAENGQLKLAMTVKLGPIVAAFAGDAEMKLDDSSYAGSVSGGGSDRKSGSRVKGEAAFSLHEQPGAAPSTRVDVRVDFTIAGSLAQFSRGGIVQELAARMTEAFAANLQAKLEAESAVSAQADETAGQAAIEASLPIAANGTGVEHAAGQLSATPQSGTAQSVTAQSTTAQSATAAGSAPGTQTQRPDPASPAPAAARPPVSNAPLDLGQLFWPMLLGRLRRMFGLKSKP